MPIETVARNDRAPHKLNELAPVPDRRWRWLLVPLASALLVAALVAWDLHRPAKSIDEVRLEGPRSPVPVSLVILLDESESFQQYADIREQALRDVSSWSLSNLRPDDQITVISFAGSATVRMTTVTVADMASGDSITNIPPLTGGTSIQPALKLAAASTDTTLAQSLIAITDTAVSDAHAPAVSQAIRELNVTSMSLIIPQGVTMREDWAATFPYQLVVEAPVSSADQNALAIARAAAHATGQTLEINR